MCYESWQTMHDIISKCDKDMHIPMVNCLCQSFSPKTVTWLFVCPSYGSEYWQSLNRQWCIFGGKMVPSIGFLLWSPSILFLATDGTKSNGCFSYQDTSEIVVVTFSTMVSPSDFFFKNMSLHCSPLLFTRCFDHLITRK